MTLTNRLISLLILLSPLAVMGQVSIGAKMFVGTGATVSINSNNNVVSLNDSLTNLGIIQMSSSRLVVNSAGTLINENRVSVDSQIVFNGGRGLNHNGSRLAAGHSLLVSDTGRLINQSSIDTVYSGKLILIDNNGLFRNTNGLVLSDSSLVLQANGVFQNLGTGRTAVSNDVYSTSSSSNIVNQGFIRAGRSWVNRGNYGLSTEAGVVILGDTAGNINSREPIHTLILDAPLTSKSLQDSLFIRSSLQLQAGAIVTNSFAVRMDSSGRIPRSGAFNNISGGRIVGTLVRQQIFDTAPRTDSLYFPVGAGINFLPLVVRDMPSTQPLKHYVVTAFDPVSQGTGSFDVSRVFNDQFGWRFEAFPTQTSERVLVAAPVGGGLDTLVVAQSGAVDGFYESLGAKDTANGAGSQRIIASDFTPDKPFLAIGSSQNLKLSLKVYLQGRQKLASPFDMTISNSTYNDTLNLKFASQVLETYRPIPSNVVDSISISIRATTPAPAGAILETIPAWLMADGSIRDFRTLSDTFVTFSRQPTGPFHIVIDHRNHLSLMTNTPVSLSRTPSAFADLTQIANVYGAGAFLPTISGNHAAMYAGNARNNNQEVNAGDQYDVISQFLQTGYRLTDVNLSGESNALDIDITREGSFSLYFSTVP
jgi:hypothetical protein